LCTGWYLASGQNGGLAVRNPAWLYVQVSEAGTDIPVQMASVYIVPVGDTVITAFSFTDKNGVVSISGVPAGRYNLNVQMLGFKPYMEETLLDVRRRNPVCVSLEEDFRELEGATVTAMGELVTAKGDTLIYNATSFRTESDANLGDLLKKMPGMEVNKGQVKVNGEPVTKITVEGKTFFFGDQSKALNYLPANIVNKINVMDDESGDISGLGYKRVKMDIRLKDEYCDGWFGRVSADGGASVMDESVVVSDPVRALYNAKLYSSYYGERDRLTFLGGAKDVNSGQISHDESGLVDIRSFGVNYNNSRIRDMDMYASASYDYRDKNDCTESLLKSFQASEDQTDNQMETRRSRRSDNINCLTKTSFDIGNLLEKPGSEGFHVWTGFKHNKRLSSGEDNSVTRNIGNYESVLQNSSNSWTRAESVVNTAEVKVKAQYFLDKSHLHYLSFRGGILYDGSRGSSQDSSVTRFGESGQKRKLHYDDRNDRLQFSGTLSYSAECSDHWNLYTTVSVDYDSSKDWREARDSLNNRRESYSKDARDKSVNMKESISASYFNRFGGRLLSTKIGVCLYEDYISHLSYQNPGANDLCNVTAGPVASVSYNDSKNLYLISTKGNSTLPFNGAARSMALDVSDPVNISTGNIYLKSGYHQDVVMQVRLHSERMNSALLSMRLIGAFDINEATWASWYDSSAVRYSIPVNSKRPCYNAGLDVTYVQPLNEEKSLNLTITPKLSFSRMTNYVSQSGPLPGLDRQEFDYAGMMALFYGDRDGSRFYSGESGFIWNDILRRNWSLKGDLKYEVGACSLRCGGEVGNTGNEYSASPAAEVDNWRFNAFGELLWRNKTGWEIETRFDYYGYQGFSDRYNNPEYLLNFKLAKAIKSFTVILSAYDILDSAKSFQHISSADYVEDTYHSCIGRCILIGLSFDFGKWSRIEKLRQQQMEKSRNL